jgi:hypothetical protein
MANAATLTRPPQIEQAPASLDFNNPLLTRLEAEYNYNDPDEEHGRSLAAHRRWGIRLRIADLAIGQVQQEERNLQAIEARAMVFDDYVTGVAEMLKTDPEFRNYLDVETESRYRVENNQVVAPDRSAMVPMLQNGVDNAKKEAESNSEFDAQVTRCEVDVEVAKRVDALEPGETLWGVSMEPKEELNRYHDTYAGLGYREGLVYLQAYSKVDKDTMVARSFSVDMSNQELWGQLVANYGMNIPTTASANEWLRYAKVDKVSAEGAEMLLSTLRQQYYSLMQTPETRHSVNDYVDRSSEIINSFFDTYYPALAEAVESKTNNPVLQSLANTMLSANISKLSPEVREQLVTISQSQEFDNEAAKVVGSIIRYAVVEELRKGLIPFLKSGGKGAIGSFGDGALNIDQLIAGNVKSGVEAGRSYGGCPGNIDLGSGGDSKPFENKSFQEIYGGACPEVKDGQWTTCPSCNKRVQAIVPDKETIYCANGDCKLAAPDLKAKKTKVSNAASRIIEGWKLPKVNKKTTEKSKVKQLISSATSVATIP